MKVWVTRDEPPDGPLSTALRTAGLQVVHGPVLTRRVLTNAVSEISKLSPDDWLVLTSVYAVEAVDLGAARIPHVAVVGEASHRAANKRGFRVDLVCSTGVGKDLFAELHMRVTSGIICYPRSSQAAVPDEWQGITLLSPVLYETLPRSFDKSVPDSVDIVAVTSPSAVTAINRPDLHYASIGPTTSAALRNLGCEPRIEAPDRAFASLAAAIADL